MDRPILNEIELLLIARFHGRSKLRWEENNEMGLKEVGCARR
jgi:hypothetical protein